MARLTLLYTSSALAILVLCTVVLYWVLASHLEEKNQQFLTDQLHVLRAILQEHPGDLNALEEEVQWEGTTRRFAKYYARILDADGKTWLESPDMGKVMPPAFFPLPVGGGQELEDGIERRSRRRRSYLLLAAWAEVGHSGDTSQLLQVALDVSHDDAFLRDYRRKLAIVLLLGIVCSAGAGAAVAHSGMRPLEAIARAAQRITTARLHERIDPTRWPRELTALATALDEMLTRLAEVFTRMSEFSADLAHELRTPINNLMGEAEVALSRARTPEEYRQVLESSLEEYARLSHMIESLLFLARADRAEGQATRSLLDAFQEVEAVREFHEAAADDQGVEVICQGKARLYTDPMLFRRAVSNLLSNALQYTPRGGTITIAVEELADQAVEVSVRDTGCGIESEHLPRVFDRFYRADRARSHSPKGTGLGLAIVKSIMDLHQGTITIQSEPGKGTTVTLRFPPAPV
jgi:two-component system heavy metal sensor histidine kinase CusS